MKAPMHKTGEWFAQLKPTVAPTLAHYPVVTLDGGPIAYVPLTWIPEGMNEGNALLVAAAPALLAAVAAGAIYSDALERYQAQGQRGKFVSAAALDALFEVWSIATHTALKKAGLE